MKFCPECGTKFENQNIKFCFACGYKLVLSATSAPEEDEKPVIENDASYNINPKTETVPDTIEPISTESTMVEPDEKSGVEPEPDIDETDINIQSSDDECKQLSEVILDFSKKEFIRQAWIQLAKENIPFEVFESNFSEVQEIDHQVLIDFIAADIEYRAKIGHYRQEPYIDYETYYEDEPYITTETYYDYNAKENRTRQVTKYKKVARQRQVTKYKQVTDWSPYSATGSTESIVSVENIVGLDLDKSLFDKSFIDSKSRILKGKTARINASAKSEAMSDHRSAIRSYVYGELYAVGDDVRDMRYNIAKITNASSSLCSAKEYKTRIEYNGETYERYAFPFGKMRIAGKTIKNEESPESIKAQILNKAKEENEAAKKGIEKQLWLKTKWFYFASIGLLILSILFSCFLRYPTPVIIAFVLAVVSCVTSNVITKKQNKKIINDVEAEISKRNSEVKEYIEKYSVNYEKKVRDLLNKKLKSLDLKPVKDGELSLTKDDASEK